MNGLNVLLINPKASAHWDRRIPFGLAYLAAVIRDKSSVRIIDMPAENISDKELVDCIKREGFGVVGITGMTHQIMHAYSLTKLIKQQTKSVVILGGCHVTFCPEEAIKEGADFVVIGEGEKTFTELLEAISKNNNDYLNINGLAYKNNNGKVIITPKRELIDINELPPPARDLLPVEKYTDARIFGRPALEFMFGRGCPHNCIFCSSPKMWERKIRLFSLDRIIEEIGYNTKRYNNRYIFITDDVFTVKRQFVLDFCDRIKNMKLRWACISRVDMVDQEMLVKMKGSGCVRVSYGVESGNQKILDFERKGITIERTKETFQLHRKIGLPAKALMIVGHPLETRETIQQSIDLAKELDSFGDICAQMMCPYIGTELYDSIASKTGKITTYDWNDYITWKYPPVFIPRDLDAKTIYEAAQRFSEIRGTTFKDYVTVFRLVGLDIFNWDFFFRPIISTIFKKLLPKFMVEWVKKLKQGFRIEV